jgi:hypothetical protein
VLNAIALMNDHGKVFGIPRVMEGHTLANLALLVGATALSFWFARGPRPLAWAAGIVSVIALIGVLHTDQPTRYIDSGRTYGDDTPVSDYSGTEVNNLFVYDANGKPIKSAYVLRDDGMPLDLGNGKKLLDYSSALDAKAVKYSYVPGLFPQPQVVADFDEYGGYDVKVDLPKHPKVVVPKVPGTSSNDRSP